MTNNLVMALLLAQRYSRTDAKLKYVLLQGEGGSIKTIFKSYEKKNITKFVFDFSNLTPPTSSKDSGGSRVFLLIFAGQEVDD